jgi:hypothetical protein
MMSACGVSDPPMGTHGRSVAGSSPASSGARATLASSPKGARSPAAPQAMRNDQD